MSTCLAAVVQLTTGADPEAAFAQAESLVAQAAERGAQLVALPENVHFMGPEAAKLTLAEPIDGPSFQRLGALAKRHRLWLLGGTLPETAPSAARAYNTSTLWDPSGALAARYRKIHLFDVALGEGATHLESASVEPGTSLTVVETPVGTIGMSVCYDLRFGALYRAMVRAGAQIFTIPAAFTVPTGRDHWEILVRARAIENQCFVLAPGQYGANTDTRRTYGRSMIVDPWGTVLAQAPDRPSVAVASIDLEQVAQLRRKLPCLDHERPDSYSVVGSP